MGGLACRGVQEAVLLEERFYPLGYGRRRVDEAHLLAGNFFDGGNKKRIMGTTQYNMIGAGVEHGAEILLKQPVHFGTFEVAGFHQFHQAVAGLFDECYLRGEALQRVVVQAAFERAPGGQYAHHAAFGMQGGRLHRRLHAHKRHGIRVAQVCDGRNSGRITSHHDELYLFGK